MANASKKHKQAKQDLRDGDRRDDGDAEGASREESSELESLRARVAELEAELEDVKSQRQRALADYMNYQKRALVNEREAREEGAGRVVESLLTVADYLDMALKQDPSSVPAKAVMDGVWLIREELHKVFQEYGVQPVRPRKGEDLDPARHDAMGHEAASDVNPGCIVRIEQPGYSMGGRVLRPAKVYIAPENNETEDSDDADV